MTRERLTDPPPGLRGPVPLFATLDVLAGEWEHEPDACRDVLRRRLQRVADTIPPPPYWHAGPPDITLERPAWDRSRRRPGWVTLYGRGRGEPA